MLNGQTNTTILETSNGIVRLCNDALTDSYSIGIRTSEGFQWKYVSKKLHDLLVEELGTQAGRGF